MGSFSSWHWLMLLVILALWLVPQIFFITTLQAGLKAIDDALRPVAPGLTWLLLLPIFNIIWIFFLVFYLRNGYKRMWENQRLTQETSAGFGVGIGFAVSSVFCLVPGPNVIALLPAIVLWILYWVQVSQTRHLVKPVEATLPHLAVG